MLLCLFVFTMDECDELIPSWLNFVTGVVGSSFSRETLQRINTVRCIENDLVKTCLELFAEIAEKPDDSKTCYEQFEKCLRLGVQTDFTNRTETAEFLPVNASNSGDERISFKEYGDRLKEGQCS